MFGLLEIGSFVVKRRAELQAAAQATAPELSISIPPGMLDALVAAEMARPQARAALQAHYCVNMPGMLRDQLLKRADPEARLFGHRIELGHMPRLRGEAARQEQRNRELRDENARLAKTVKELSPPVNPAALEKAAREQLGFVRPDEVLFKFE